MKTMNKNMEDLPDWLQELWDKDYSLARKAEKYLNVLNTKKVIQETIDLNLLDKLERFDIDFNESIIIPDKCGEFIRVNDLRDFLKS